MFFKWHSTTWARRSSFRVHSTHEPALIAPTWPRTNQISPPIRSRAKCITLFGSLVVKFKVLPSDRMVFPSISQSIATPPSPIRWPWAWTSLLRPTNQPAFVYDPTRLERRLIAVPGLALKTWPNSQRRLIYWCTPFSGAPSRTNWVTSFGIQRPLGPGPPTTQEEATDASEQSTGQSILLSLFSVAKHVLS